MKYLFWFNYLFMVCFLSIYTYCKDSNSPWFSYVLIILLGIPYAWVNKKWLTSEMRKIQDALSQERVELEEPILEKTYLIHIQKVSYLNGIGYLLVDKLVFVPLKQKKSRKGQTIPFAEIDRITGYKILGLFDVGLKIIMKSKKVDKFVIDRKTEMYKSLLNVNQ